MLIVICLRDRPRGCAQQTISKRSLRCTIFRESCTALRIQRDANRAQKRLKSRATNLIAGSNRLGSNGRDLSAALELSHTHWLASPPLFARDCRCACVCVCVRVCECASASERSAAASLAGALVCQSHWRKRARESGRLPVESDQNEYRFISLSGARETRVRPRETNNLFRVALYLVDVCRASPRTRPFASSPIARARGSSPNLAAARVLARAPPGCTTASSRRRGAHLARNRRICAVRSFALRALRPTSAASMNQTGAQQRPACVHRPELRK